MFVNTVYFLWGIRPQQHHARSFCCGFNSKLFAAVASLLELLVLFAGVASFIPN